jgi:CheY-like chemotaxis protein
MVLGREMKTVLVVEDVEDLRTVFMDVVRQAGYGAIGAENGKRALEILQSLEEQPCLVLLDWMMPVMDGQTFLRELRATHRFASLPIVIVSAQTVAGEGADKIVKKPMSASALMPLVREYCG